MNKEIKSLEIMVKHYENKEKKLIKMIENEIKDVNDIIESIESYNVRRYWSGFNFALELVLEKIEELERIK